jgi:RNA polymerase sigma factor (sigma-70 family)
MESSAERFAQGELGNSSQLKGKEQSAEPIAHGNSGLNDNTIQSGVDFVAANANEVYAMLRRLIMRKYAQHRDNVDNIVDEIFSDVILETCNDIWNAFDPLRGDAGNSRRGFMFARFQFAARNWLSKRRLQDSRFLKISDVTNAINRDSHTDSEFLTADNTELQSFERSRARAEENCAISALERREFVISLLGSLPARMEQVVRMHIMYGFTFEEIATKIGGSASGNRLLLNEAMSELYVRASQQSAATS